MAQPNEDGTMACFQFSTARLNALKGAYKRPDIQRKSEVSLVTSYVASCCRCPTMQTSSTLTSHTTCLRRLCILSMVSLTGASRLAVPLHWMEQQPVLPSRSAGSRCSAPARHQSLFKSVARHCGTACSWAGSAAQHSCSRVVEASHHQSSVFAQQSILLAWLH